MWQRCPGGHLSCSRALHDSRYPSRPTILQIVTSWHQACGLAHLGLDLVVAALTSGARGTNSIARLDRAPPQGQRAPGPPGWVPATASTPRLCSNSFFKVGINGSRLQCSAVRVRVSRLAAEQSHSRGRGGSTSCSTWLVELSVAVTRNWSDLARRTRGRLSVSYSSSTSRCVCRSFVTSFVKRLFRNR